MIDRRQFIALPLFSAIPVIVKAQDYPSKPVRIIVSTAAGTTSDGASRFFAKELSKRIGGTYVVENKVGADGLLATDAVAKAKGDGYTLLTAFASHYILPWVGSTSFDAVRDFEPVMQFGQSSIVMITATSSPLKSLRDVIERSRNNPGQLAYGTAAATSTMAAALLGSAEGIEFRKIPYGSSSQSIVDTAAGLVDFTFVGASAAKPLILSNRIRALGVTSAKRADSLPDVPTFVEQGVSGYDFSTPHWIFVPRNTPEPIINRLSQELMQIASSPEFTSFAKAQGFNVVVRSAESLKANAVAELEKWGRLVKLAGLNTSR